MQFPWRILGYGLILACLVTPGRLVAQAVSGSITGVVADQTGGLIPGAGVVVTNHATGLETRATTNQSGLYSVSNLISGTYRLVVSVAGFKTFEQETVNVRIGAVVRLDVPLEVGDVAETIAVTEHAPVLKADRVDLSGTVSEQQLHALPTLGRNPTALSKLQPGIIENPGQQGLPGAGNSGSYSISANGQRAQLNVQLLDGVDNTEGISGGAPLVPAVDAMQEFTVTTANYDVEFGQVAGAVSIMTTKSGTNEWHGSGYHYNRVNRLFARNSFSEPEKAGHFVWNQYGATLGGPVAKNRTFVFGTFQGVNMRSGGNVRLTVPTDALKAGNFSALADNPVFDPLTGGGAGVGRTQFVNNTIPNDRLIQPVQTLLGTLPQPNLSGTDQNFTAPNVNPINEYTATGRIDHAFDEYNRMFVRYTRRVGDAQSAVPAFGRAVWASGYVDDGSNDSLAVDYTRLFSPTFLIEGRFGWTRRNWKRDAVDQDSATSQDFGFPNLNEACPACGGLAGFRIGGPVGAFDVGNSDHNHQLDNYGGYNYVGIASLIRGSHTFKFGGDANLTWRERFDSASMGNYGCFNGGLCGSNGFAQSITGSPDVSGSGLSMGTFLLGMASDFQRIIYDVSPASPMNQNRMSLFFQDTWRVSRKLTLNLGLRWDYIGFPRSDAAGGIVNYDLNTAEMLISNFGSTSGTAGVKDNLRDFGPRIGFAYQATPKTVVRSGFARTFSIGFFGANFGAINNQWPIATRQRILPDDPYSPALLVTQGPPSFIGGFDILEAAGNPGRYPAPNSTVFGTDSRNPTHSVDQWNFAIQHQLNENLSATLTYVGNASRHLFYRRNYNAALPGPGSFNERKPYTPYGITVPIYNQSNQTSSGYHGLQGQLEKRYSKGVLFTTSFTWGKGYDFGEHNSNNGGATAAFAEHLDRAALDYDRAFVFAVGHVWDLPFGPGNRFATGDGPLRHLVGGWQFSGITRWMSGRPFSPSVGNTASLNSDCCGLRPDRNGVGTVSNPSREQWFDKDAFTIPGPYLYGTSGRNILRGPAFFTGDWALSKTFTFTERTRLEFRWEMYNVFNTTNLNNPVTGIDSAIGGMIFGTSHPMRRQQLGLHLYF